jgi:penicillin amidase
VPIDGSGQTPNVGSNVSMRHIASPGNWDATRHVIPLGESGDPKSDHFKDQFDAWRTGGPAVFPFTKAAVEKAAVSVLVMAPR